MCWTHAVSVPCCLTLRTGVRNRGPQLPWVTCQRPNYFQLALVTYMGWTACLEGAALSVYSRILNRTDALLALGLWFFVVSFLVPACWFCHFPVHGSFGLELTPECKHQRVQFAQGTKDILYSPSHVRSWIPGTKSLAHHHACFSWQAAVNRKLDLPVERNKIHKGLGFLSSFNYFMFQMFPKLHINDLIKPGLEGFSKSSSARKLRSYKWTSQSSWQNACLPSARDSRKRVEKAVPVREHSY